MLLSSMRELTDCCNRITNLNGGWSHYPYRGYWLAQATFQAKNSNSIPEQISVWVQFAVTPKSHVMRANGDVRAHKWNITKVFWRKRKNVPTSEQQEQGRVKHEEGGGEMTERWRHAHSLEPCMCVTRIRMCDVYAQCMYSREVCVQQVSVCTLSVAHTTDATSSVRTPVSMTLLLKKLKQEIHHSMTIMREYRQASFKVLFIFLTKTLFTILLSTKCQMCEWMFLGYSKHALLLILDEASVEFKPEIRVYLEVPFPIQKRNGSTNRKTAQQKMKLFEKVNFFLPTSPWQRQHTCSSLSTSLPSVPLLLSDVVKCSSCSTSLIICCKADFVRGSYSARVPRSSLAEVRRVLVTHTMEEEDEDQEDEQDDKREKKTARSGRENRRESEQPHHERMKMGRSEMCAARQTWANVDVTLKCANAVRECDVWSVLFMCERWRH